MSTFFPPEFGDAPIPDDCEGIAHAMREAMLRHDRAMRQRVEGQLVFLDPTAIPKDSSSDPELAAFVTGAQRMAPPQRDDLIWPAALDDVAAPELVPLRVAFVPAPLGGLGGPDEDAWEEEQPLIVVQRWPDGRSFFLPKSALLFYDQTKAASPTAFYVPLPAHWNGGRMQLPDQDLDGMPEPAALLPAPAFGEAELVLRVPPVPYE